ncbi:MAG TPA: M14 family zinc carboxypeptidase, partial [Gemmataceae bacterium]|nr:M14 family zinc carboxypeptidase [Gemmataceae bacterium]
MTRTLLVTLALSLAPPLSAADITTPKEHFGFNMGDDYCLANYKQFEAYLKKIEKQTDRLKVVNIGKTEEGRDQLMAVVTSPANHKKLERYREIAGKLARAEGVTAAEARKLADEGKAVVWIDGGLHANEVLCAQALTESIFHFVTATDAEALRILDEVVILFVHCNPDGHD